MDNKSKMIGHYLPCKLVAVAFLIIWGCTQDHIPSQVAAKIGDENITLDKVDNLIQEQLYESLFGIYYKRKIALEEFLADQLIQMEAERLGISKDSLKSVKKYGLLSKESLDLFIKNHHLESGIADKNDPFALLNINSLEGRQLLKDAYGKKQLELYIDSLIKKYQVKITLMPPVPPRIDLSGVSGHVRGSRASKLEIILVSDFRCSACKAFFPTWQAIISEYENRATIEYLSYSSNISLPILLAECSSTSGKFWRYVDLAYTRHPMDSADYMNLFYEAVESKAIGTCLNDSLLLKRIEANFQALHNLGITGTPTLIINGRVYHGELSIKKINEYVKLVSTD